MTFLSGVWIGLCAGFVCSLVVLGFFRITSAQRERAALIEWGSAAYQVLEFGASIMPREKLPSWTGVCCVLESVPEPIVHNKWS